MFTKRHYEWLAKWAGRNIDESACARLASALKEENPEFNWDEFIEACDEKQPYRHGMEALKRSATP